jgi:hypothetical protein
VKIGFADQMSRIGQEGRSKLGQVTFSYAALMILILGGVALFGAVREYYSRDRLPYFRAQMITSLAMAIGLIAIASFYFMDLMDKSWTFDLFILIYCGLGLLRLSIYGVSRFANATRWGKLFIASAIGIGIILMSVVGFLIVRNACQY